MVRCCQKSPNFYIGAADFISLAEIQELPTAFAVLSPIVPSAFFVFLIHFTMCRFSYFKDREGDAAVGKRTMTFRRGLSFWGWLRLIPKIYRGERVGEIRILTEPLTIESPEETPAVSALRHGNARRRERSRISGRASAGI
ncbi:MAG: hypothetical protein E7029_04160 [Planctomycetaceae bacterium]|nr:hypothetical protein [Planctomycetaceae bacterium]